MASFQYAFSCDFFKKGKGNTESFHSGMKVSVLHATLRYQLLDTTFNLAYL